MPGIEVDVIDNSAPIPMNKITDHMRVEVYQALKAIVVQNKYDVVVSHSYNSGFVFSFLRSMLHRNTPRHYVIDVGSLNGGDESAWQIEVIRYALKSVDGLIYHSKVCEEFYSRHFPTRRRRFVPFGIDTDFFAPLASVPTDDYALSIGYAKRDYTTLIRAWRNISFPLKIVGVSRRWIQKNGNVEFLPRVPILELRRLMHNARFVILPIDNVKHSTGQTTLLQCMSMGKPVIATRAHGIIDYCSHGSDCLLVKNADLDDYVDKIMLLMEDTDIARRISSNARKTTAEKFNEKQMAESIYRLFVEWGDS